LAQSYCWGGLQSDAPGKTVISIRPLLLFLALAAASGQDQGPTGKPFTVTARRFSFDPPRIEVNQDDLVKIELRTEDIAHSLTIDAYRIAKRVSQPRPQGLPSPNSCEGSKPASARKGHEDGTTCWRRHVEGLARRGSAGDGRALPSE
jgi:hypothetical protein